MKKIIVYVLIIIFVFLISFGFLTITTWLVCKCIGCDFRWLYPITAMFIIPILSSIFKPIYKNK